MGLQDDKDIGMNNIEDANTSVEMSLDELSDTWRELLGLYFIEEVASVEKVAVPSSLADDPWSQLLHAQGNEIIDLQHLRLHELEISLSELEVEEALQFMREQSCEGKNQG